MLLYLYREEGGLRIILEQNFKVGYNFIIILKIKYIFIIVMLKYSFKDMF